MRQEKRKEITLILKVLVWVVFLSDFVLQIYFRKVGFGIANRGVSFGFAPEWGGALSLFGYAVFIFVYFYQVLILKKDLYFSMMMAVGGLGNLIARLIYGSVWDYISVSFLPFSFNLSDVLISLGVVSYILGVDDRSDLRGQKYVGDKQAGGPGGQ